jgi:hypothetical protein
MKVLVTGMASSHIKPSTNTTFFGKLVSTIGTFSTVEWATPSVTWTEETLSKYDIVLVGVIPPTSLGANKVYGAMHVINMLYNSPKLRLVLDHPQLWQFKSSLASIDRDVSSIFTPFYSKRREYNLAIDPTIAGNISSAAFKLLSETWPKTIYPALPWSKTETIEKYISAGSTASLYGINLDSFLLENPVISENKIDMWVSESIKSPWSTKLEKLLKFPVVPMKVKANDSDATVYSRISTGLGALVSVHDRGVGSWWSYRYIQALNSGTPVISDWRETNYLDASWNILGSTLEDLSPYDRSRIAENQRESYISAIPNKNEAIEFLKSVINFN